MKTWSRVLGVVAVLALIFSISAGIAGASTTKDYGDVTLTGGFQTGHFPDVWSLAACDMTVSFTYDANGLEDAFGGNAHAWAELGVRAVNYGDFNPTWQAEGAGVWLATDYDWTVNTFDPDPVGFPTLDLDDKLILQKGGGWGEGSYNLPSTPPAPGNNHRVWWDRDGVDPWQNGETANTNGLYDVVITLHANNATSGTAYMNIRGLDQGFETDGNWNTIELTPAGMTFTGNMAHMQVFYGLYGYGATHTVAFEDIAVTGCLQPAGVITSPGEGEVVFGMADFGATYSDDDPSGVQWGVRYNTCAAATNTVWGNVDGHNDPFTWDGSAFLSQADTSSWVPGPYCFVFNPTEGPGEDDMRLTRWFEVMEVIPPTASPTQDPEANAKGWNNTDVTITWNWADEEGGSGIDEENCTMETLVTDEGEDIEVTATCSDLDGNEGEATYYVSIDKTAPTFGDCPEGGPFDLNTGLQPVGPITVNADISGLDGGSSTLSGSVDTSSVGWKAVLFTATDNAGNPTTKTCSYQVIYNWNGFFRPVDNRPIFNVAKAGSAIPVKFSLSGNQGLNIFAEGYPQSIGISCDTGAPSDGIEETLTAGGSSLSYDPIADQYVYVWKTLKSWAGTCRQLEVKLIDGTSHYANFQFK